MSELRCRPDIDGLGQSPFWLAGQIQMLDQVAVPARVNPALMNELQAFGKPARKARYERRYLLTPKGIESRAKMMVEFFKHKVQEYERLKADTEELKREVRDKGLQGGAT